MRLTWITDPHFNFLPPFGALAFGQYVAKETGCDAVVLTGDIAESKSLEKASKGFAEGLDKPVYFVLGNHDYYGGSIRATRDIARNVAERNLLHEKLSGNGTLSLNRLTHLRGQAHMRWRNLLVLISLVGLIGCTSSPRNVHTRESSRTINVDGYRLRLLAAGKGTPTVVLESGLGAGVESWTKLQPSVSKFTQIVAYDHPGVGGSEPRPKPRTGQQIATELNTALKSADLGPPYVLVGHSTGGPYIHVFASLYPNEVAGMVFVDPTQERSSQEHGDLTEWLRVITQEKSET
jgi:hypothetical protein